MERKTIIKLAVGTAVLSLILFAVGMTAAVNQINEMAIEDDLMMVKEKSSAAVDVDLGNALRTATVDYIFDEEAIPAYSTSEIMAMDVSQPSGVTLSDLELVTRQALIGLEPAFLKAEEDYGINCLFVMAIASIESGNGTICYRPNNMFGYGGMSFSSKEECIDTVARGLANNYLAEGGSLYSGKTISSVNRRYASSSKWDDKVAAAMTNYYAIISEHHNEALEKLK